MKSLSISEITQYTIEHRAIITHFQTIKSIRYKGLTGVEALSRGIDPNGKLIPPKQLINNAQSKDELSKLDKLFQEKAIESFAKLHKEYEHLILFINLETSLLDKSCEELSHLLACVNKHQINPNHIAIELVESKVSDVQALQEMIQVCRQEGFLIVLDDVGVGFSNLDRIPLIKPDIIKIDKSLIRNIHKEYYKQEVCRSLVGLAQRIGALVVAEGIETEEEALYILQIDIDMLQGFYLSKPRPVDHISDWFQHRIDHLSSRFHDHLVNHIVEQKRRDYQHDALSGHVLKYFENIDLTDMNHKLLEIIKHFPAIECMFILNLEGVQISDTIMQPDFVNSHKGIIFQAAPAGSDHTLKDYYFVLLSDGINIYRTSPYISMASGKLCTTISSLFKDQHNHDYILCIDFDPKQSMQEHLHI